MSGGDDFDLKNPEYKLREPLISQEIEVVSEGSADVEVVQKEFKPSSSFSAFITVFKAICGTGILTLPYGVRMFGLVYGTLGMMFMSLISLYTTRMLIFCLGGVRDSMKIEEYDNRDLGYDDIGKRAFGGKAWFGVVTAISTILCQLGTCCSIIIFIKQNMNAVTGESDTLMALIAGGLVAILAQLRSTGLLWPTSILGNFALVASVVLVFYYGFSKTDPWKPLNKPELVDASGFATFFGLAVFTFSAHAEALSIEQSMRNVKKFNVVLNWMYLVVTVIYMVFGVLGFLFFREHTDSIIFVNLKSKDDTIWVKAVQSLMSAAVLFSFPINLFPATVIIEESLVPKAIANKKFAFEATRTLIRFITVVGCVVVSIVFKEFGQFTAFIGALTNGVIAFVLPPMMYISLFRKTSSWFSIGVNSSVAVFGVVASVFSTVVIGIQLVKSFHK